MQCWWILPSQKMTPLRPTTGGERSPTRAPTQRYDIGMPERGRQGLPEQNDMYAQESEEIWDLFREGNDNDWGSDGMNFDELESAVPSSHAHPTPSASSLAGPRCVQGHLTRPSSLQEEGSSTACCSSNVDQGTPGGVTLSSGIGRGKAPCCGHPPGLPKVPATPLPAMSSSGPAAHTQCPRIWQTLGSHPKSSPSGTSPGGDINPPPPLIYPSGHRSPGGASGAGSTDEDQVHQDEIHQWRGVQEHPSEDTIIRGT